MATGTVLNLEDIIIEDQLGKEIARFWVTWGIQRQEAIEEWSEISKYIFATSTKKTTNSKLPWKNTTTIPKLCQIRDNLNANYMASVFPNPQWLVWEGAEETAQTRAKTDAIRAYMAYAVSQPGFKQEIAKLILDYIDKGNCFAGVEWVDRREKTKDGKLQAGFVGPQPRRISPLDIIFNPVAPNFTDTPKIERSIVSLGEIKEILTRMSTDENKEVYEELYAYLKGIRAHQATFGGDFQAKNEQYKVDGFTSYRAYLDSTFVELLTFRGDIYDPENDVLLRNHEIIVADRHKVISKRPEPSVFGYAPIFHAGWRKRQDNLWAMSPLANLVGLQYRIDHIENLKADVFDLLTFPPLKVKGYVEDFNWGPFERIYVGDDGDVEILAPPFQILQANIEIQGLMQQMEELSGSPREAMGFRTPGEKTKYEVSRLENASSRIFQNKIMQFEEEILEPLLNGMLELARRNFTEAMSVPVFDNEFDAINFLTLSPTDLVGAGRIKPIAARHFVEQAERVQNLTTLFTSPIGQDPGFRSHWSGIRMAQMFEEDFGLRDYHIVQPYIRLAEDADAQRQIQQYQQQLQEEATTATGIGEDYDMSPEEQAQVQGAVQQSMTSE